MRGRGAEHQADALGELTVPTPFMLPVRLFCEAKYLNHKVGLEVIRNALGVLNDVNEQFGSTGATTKAPMRRFQYRYSIFSASGFTSDAEAYALAQQISLIDLRGPAFGYLLQAADRVTDALRAWQQQEGALSYERSPRNPTHGARYRRPLRLKYLGWPTDTTYDGP